MDYEFIFDKLNEKFSKMQEDEKVRFCQQVKEGWNESLNLVFEDIVRGIIEKLSFEKQESIENVILLQKTLRIFMEFKRKIDGYKSLLSQKVNRLNDASEKFKSL